MSERIGSFDESSARRIAKVVRRMEQTPSSRSGFPPRQRRPSSSPPLGPFLCKPTEDIDEGESGQCEIYAGDKGAEIATGEFLEDVFSRWGNVTDEHWVLVEAISNGYEITVAKPC
ncbi:MAG: hypothetical protein AB7G12_12810 [Thermoanaerobaculia bacterium]